MPELRVFCEKDHERVLMSHDSSIDRFLCDTCNHQVTSEVTFRSLPPQYKAFFESDFGSIIAAMADIGAIDVIYKNKYVPYFEQSRIKDMP